MVWGWSWSMKIAERSSAISGSSRAVPRARPDAGAGRQGRRPEGIPLVFRGSRTPPGGDRRPPIACGMVREEPLAPHQFAELVDDHPAHVVAGQLAVRLRPRLDRGRLRTHGPRLEAGEVTERLG